MKRYLALSVTALILAITSVPGATAMAQSDDPQAQEASALELRANEVISVINGEIAAEDYFNDAFLAQVPAAQFAAISQQITGQFGKAIAVQSLEPNDAGTRAAITVRMEKAIASGSIGIDPANANRVNELLFRSFDPIDDSPEKIEADLAALPGTVSWWYGKIDGSDPILSGEAGAQMPLGSTFKLYVLAALAREVAQGKRSWDDVITIDSVSYPSGILQNWPKGAPITLHSAASLMISISDNTATDILIDELGRDVVEQAVIDSGHSQAALNQPFLKTHDMFELKAGSASRLAAFQAGDTAAQREILASLGDEAVPTSTVLRVFSGNPTALDVEWFGNAADLVSLMRFMRETADAKAFEIMAINPSMGAPMREKWSYVGYKGGSEPGVLNLTWLMTDQASNDHVLFLSWRNDDAPVEQSQFELIAQRILSLPR